jgi:hypothetical protein
MRNGEGGDLESREQNALFTLYLQGLSEGRSPIRPIEVIGDGPAVNIEGLSEVGESSKSKRRKGYRKNIRSTSVENSGAISFASIAYGK